MDLCRSRLEVWNKTEFRHVQRKISKIHKHLQCLEKQYSMPNIIKVTCDTRKEFNDWLDKEYAMWNQRSNIYLASNGGIGILLSYMLRLQVISNAIILMGFMMKSSLASGGIRNWEGISHILL